MFSACWLLSCAHLSQLGGMPIVAALSEELGLLQSNVESTYARGNSRDLLGPRAGPGLGLRVKALLKTGSIHTGLSSWPPAQGPFNLVFALPHDGAALGVLDCLQLRWKLARSWAECLPSPCPAKGAC